MISNSEDGCQGSENQFTGDSKHDDSEELTDDLQGCLSQVFRQPVGTDQHQIQYHDTQQERDTEAGNRILRRDGQKRREGARTRVHRESQRYDRARTVQVRILENGDIQNHL